MKLISFTVLNTTETHLIVEIEYSVSNLFSREKTIKRKIFKKINDVYWRFLDTNEIYIDYEGLNAIIPTKETTYKI